jgi:hypothetical protein
VLPVQVGHGHEGSIGLKSVACLASPDRWIRVWGTGMQEGFVRRFIGPLCVRATPKRAVRVGKTQSA